MQNETIIKENVKKAFDEFPEAKEVYATSDGQVFLREDRARLHATPKGNVYPFTRADFEAMPSKAQADETKTISKTSIKAEEAIGVIKTASLEELGQFEADTRKTVVAALEARKAQLIQEIETFSENVGGTDEVGTEGGDQGTGEGEGETQNKTE